MWRIFCSLDCFQSNQNPTATINDLRNDGHAIYLNTRTNSNGDKVSFYRLGSPTKRMVAAGIAAIRQQGERAFA